MPKQTSATDERLRRVIQRAAANSAYADDATVLLELGKQLDSGDSPAARAAAQSNELVAVKGERDDARAERDKANERAEIAEKQLADVRSELEQLKRLPHPQTESAGKKS